MKLKINIDTASAVMRLVHLAENIAEPVYLTDGKEMRISAKSLLGATYAQFDFNEVWLETENDHYLLFKDFSVE